MRWLFLILTFSFAYADLETDLLKKYSFLFGQKLYSECFYDDRISFEDVIEGMRAAHKGEYVEDAFDSERFWQIREAKNLEAAERYLLEVKGDLQYLELEKDKLYYKVLQEGERQKFGTSFHITVYCLRNGRLEAEYATEKPLSLSLEDSFFSLERGVQGMRLGEKRRLVMHPDLSVCDFCLYVEPGMLCVFDVELAE